MSIDYHIQQRHSLRPWMLILVCLCGCGTSQEIPRASEPLHKIIPHRGSSVFGTILDQSDSTIRILAADSDDTLLIDRSRVHESIEVSRRREMLVTQISWNPSLSYYRSIVAPVNIGVSAQYLWKQSWMGEINAVELGGEIRVLPFGTDMRGFYLAGYLTYATVVAERSRHSFSWWWSNGWLIGWQWFPMYNIAAGVSMGAEAWHFPESESAGRELGYSGMPIARIHIGYAW